MPAPHVTLSEAEMRRRIVAFMADHNHDPDDLRAKLDEMPGMQIAVVFAQVQNAKASVDAANSLRKTALAHLRYTRSLVVLLGLAILVNLGQTYFPGSGFWDLAATLVMGALLAVGVLGVMRYRA